MKRSFTIILLFSILLVSRLFFIDKSENVILYITLINNISLIIVLISIIEDAYILLEKDINNRNISFQIKKRYIKDIKLKKNMLYFFTLFIFIDILFSCEKYNDALSIFTIGTSLLDSEISSIYKKILRKWCKL